MSTETRFPAGGGCSCGSVKYRLARAPMFVHCCHCSWCQRESGSAFAVNALIESFFVELLQGAVDTIEMPSNSGAGQKIVRCARCKSALWSHYGAAKDKVAFVRVGTLDNPDLCPPDIHIYTSTKQGWVALTDQAPITEEYYRRSSYWPEESLLRYRTVTESKSGKQ